MQMLISLFTTGGKINPIAILLFVGVSLYLYNDFQGYRERQELARQCEIYRAAAQDKLTQLNRSNTNVTETIESIDPDNLNDWVERINGMQRKAD